MSLGVGALGFQELKPGLVFLPAACGSKFRTPSYFSSTMSVCSHAPRHDENGISETKSLKLQASPQLNAFPSKGCLGLGVSS